MAAEAPLLLHAFSTLAMGGPQRRFVQIANAFGPRYRHAIVAMDGNTQSLADLSPDVAFEVVAPPVAKGGGLSLGTLRAIAGVIRNRKPDLLLSYNWGAIEWALVNRLLRAVPQLHCEDGFGPEESGTRQIPRRVWTRRLGLGGRCDLIVPSHTLETIARRVWHIPARRCHLIPNGIELDRFAAAEPLATPFGSDRTVIGTIGMLRQEKNIGRLLRAFATLEDLPVSLAIAGSGPTLAALQAESRRLGLGERVAFLGHTDTPERAQAAFDLFALSSDTEQMPYSVIEAMAAGLAVVATDVGDVRQMLAPAIADECVVAKDDEAGFAARLRWLAGDAAARARIGEANRAHVRATYGIDRMLEAWDSLIGAKIAAGR
ncbi:MAG: glycosyltransferase family 4 protein [Alphaproteobacteria bacterium]|nr:glycosyltransferase family 4 protein [Alphaproteobacteria bacterium]MCB9929153.1 glycosyltransferase family 4 protein [Alphaproteobacteria bacterium]